MTNVLAERLSKPGLKQTHIAGKVRVHFPATCVCWSQLLFKNMPVTFLFFQRWVSKHDSRTRSRVLDLFFFGGFVHNRLNREKLRWTKVRLSSLGPIWDGQTHHDFNYRISCRFVDIISGVRMRPWNGNGYLSISFHPSYCIHQNAGDVTAESSTSHQGKKK